MYEYTVTAQVSVVVSAESFKDAQNKATDILNEVAQDVEITDISF